MDFFKPNLIEQAKKIEPLYNEINTLIETINEDRETLFELQNNLEELENKESLLLELILQLAQKQIDENTKLTMLKKKFQIILEDFGFRSEEEFFKIISNKDEV